METGNEGGILFLPPSKKFYDAKSKLIQLLLRNL